MKKIFLVLLLIFSFSFTAAATFSNPINHEYKETITKTEYYPHDAVVVSVTKYAEYDNEERYSTYDYRHGYSYRTTEGYWNSQYAKSKRIDTHRYENSRTREYRGGYGSRGYYYDDEPSYYREYSPHAGGYKEGECYDYPPRNKLFYIKCP